MPKKYITCECCAFLAVVEDKDDPLKYDCPQCKAAKCDDPGNFLVITASEFTEEAELAKPTAVATYHDLHITTETLERTSIFNLPYNLEVACTRVAGWQLWQKAPARDDHVLLAGEYEGPGKGLRLDVAGHVIVDSITPKD